MALRSKTEVQDYIENHALHGHFEAALQHVVNEMSVEPLLTLSQFFARRHEELTKAAYTEAGADDSKEAGKARWPMGDIFMQFDTDNDGVLDLGEFKRALRAIGLPKREGSQAKLDEFTFKQMDTNGDGKLSPAEFDANLPLALRAKIEAKLEEGWKFDEEKWAASQKRHAEWNMTKVRGGAAHARGRLRAVVRRRRPDHTPFRWL